MAQGLNPDLTEMFTPEQLEKYRRLRAKTGNQTRACQEALARKLDPGRFPNTFGDD
jgi:hypothetical protein